jgi:dihydroorotate dehydrogenase (fumarate)
VLSGLIAWLEEHEYESIAQLRGSMSQRAVAVPAAFERAHYVRAISSFTGGIS